MVTIGIDAAALSTSACGGTGTVVYAASPLVVPFSHRPLDLPWSVRLGSGPLARSNIVWMQTGVTRLLAEDHVDVPWDPRHMLTDPASVERLAQAIALLVTAAEARARLAAAGSARVLGFTWRRTAEGMVAAFEQALAARARSAQ